MGSHSDLDHRRDDFVKELRLRAEIMSDLSMNREQSEKPLAEWKHGTMRCQVRPNDRQGIVRISIGGGDELPVSVEYCNVRGDMAECVKLLARALAALQARPAISTLPAKTEIVQSTRLQ